MLNPARSAFDFERVWAKSFGRSLVAARSSFATGVLIGMARDRELRTETAIAIGE